MNTHVKEAGFLKRFFAYVVDALLVILPTILLYNFVTSNVLFKALGGNKSTDEMYSFALDSTLLKASYSSSDSTKILLSSSFFQRFCSTISSRRTFFLKP